MSAILTFVKPSFFSALFRKRSLYVDFVLTAGLEQLVVFAYVDALGFSRTCDYVPTGMNVLDRIFAPWLG